MNVQQTTDRRTRMDAWMRDPGNAGRLIVVKSAYDHQWVVTGYHVFPRKYSSWVDAIRYATRRMAYLHGVPANPIGGDAA